jgi:RHS repeat-associated protein
VRYVRDYLNGSTANIYNHWVEIEVYGSRTMVYLGNYYEWDASSSTPTKYYYAGSERVAMRAGTGTGTTGLKWLLDDHLGSTAITADGATGAKLSELRYKPWGELRYVYQPTMTSLRYTGQRMEGIGLYDYGARWFDASLGRFIQADTIVPKPGDPQAWDRYAAMANNPVRYIDPSGHMADAGGGASSMGEDWWRKRQEKLEKKESSHPFDSSLGENNQNELTNGQKIGKALTTAFVETIIVLPTEAGLFITSLVLLNSGPAGVLVDLAVISVEIGVADFGVSLAISESVR